MSEWIGKGPPIFNYIQCSWLSTTELIEFEIETPKIWQSDSLKEISLWDRGRNIVPLCRDPGGKSELGGPVAF